MTKRKDQAMAMLTAIETGKTDTILENVSEVEYTQHNLQFGNGRDAILTSIPALQVYKATLKFLRSIEDGNLVAIQTEYTFSGQLVNGFDVFRFDGEKIVEHWDNLEIFQGNINDKSSPFDGSKHLDGSISTDETKEIARKFQQTLITKEIKNMENYFSNDLENHISGVKNGFSEYVEFLNNSSNYNKDHFIIAENNFALVTSEGVENNEEVGYYDLIRIDDHKIVEIWRTKEIFLPKEQRANENGKF
ncbi:nuclear transport factor 2 family protein [Pediococcus argentinicus]|uniref:SnoaL-like domain-containing protein n=1 Tax=Pediococcus argentinicus TaxID=480391 RepID=A0A0R2NC70_9LACO|nr:nuclear transport factor 2 family protein [Pediococcus argentinicus]KRO22107.1 hypothetical protein IV88_GL001296 [Pediococcus argentinicus]NKZ22458.1 hypothetical protein [Pediococcus argentinicus]GEP20206.1 polyketide cyclase [Pediococcus argentinicus]